MLNAFVPYYTDVIGKSEKVTIPLTATYEKVAGNNFVCLRLSGSVFCFMKKKAQRSLCAPGHKVST